MHLDSYGLPVQSDGDANDQLQRVGFYLTGILLGGTPKSTGALAMMEALHENLQPKPGIYSRYTGSNPNNVSADQLIGALAAWVALKETKQIMLMALRCLSRLGFAQNWKDGLDGSSRTKLPDFMALRALPLFCRAHVLLYPAACIADLLLLFQAALACGPVWRDDVGFTRRAEGDVDDNNTILTLFVCTSRLATPLSKLALKLYLKHRPWNLGCIGYGPDKTGLVIEQREMYHPVVGALRWYHRAESGGNPEIAELWRPIIEAEVRREKV